MGLGEALTPLGEHRFRLLWLGRVSSAIGDAIVPVALTFAVLSIHRSATALGAVLAALMIARVVFTLAGGVVADRISRRTVMLSCDLVRGAVHAFTAGMLLTHHMTLPLFIATEAIFGMAGAFFGPASDGLVPQTISPQNLQPANALLGMSRNVLYVFGPAVSGALVAVAGPGYVFAVDAVSFAASAFFLARLDVEAPQRGERTSFVGEVRAGFHEVASRAWVRAPLIGFAGGPFTLASYLIDGGPSKNHDRTKALMYGDPPLWHAILGRLADIAIEFLKVQVEAGAAAVQLFDSWVGAVSPEDDRKAVLPHTSRIFTALAVYDVPRIHFGVGTGELLSLLGEAGADVVGVDWRVPLDEAARRVPPGKALQGNLDPAVLLAPWDVVRDRTREVLTRARSTEGHIFNLGHGVLPEADPSVLARLADLVHTETSGSAF